MTTEVKISSIGAAGDGVAKTAAGAVYVPFALPGEVVNIAQEGAKATLMAVKERSSARIEPACSHFEDCGGCGLQHWQTGHYQAWKRALVQTALEGRGLKVDVEPLIACAPYTRRRVVLTARATPKGQIVGFNRYQSHDVVEITECPVAVPEIVEHFDDIRAVAAVLQDNAKSFHITVTAVKNGLDMMISGIREADEKQRQRLTKLAIKLNIARISVDDEIIIEQQKPVVDFGRVSVQIPAGGFLQATINAENAMASLVLEGLKKVKNAADLFSGSGTFTFRMAEKMNVHAVENDALALKALDRGLRYAEGLKTVTYEERDLFRRPIGAKELGAYDGLVFDPPRAGAEEQAREIAKAVISRVVAVSCNPVTLARDLAILVEGGYKIERVVPIDQFLWSPHVETVVLLSKRRPKPGWKL